MGRTRKYDATRRRAEAQENRATIVEVAAVLFETRGYAGTSVRQIAEQAGVSPETVYGAFGSKAVLLARAVDRRVGGTGGERPLVEQPWVRRLAEEPALDRRIALLAEQGVAVTERTAPLLRAVRAAALSDPEIARLLFDLQRARDQDLVHLFAFLVADEPLRPDVDRSDAVEWFATLSGDEIFLDLVERRGWPVARYRRWMSATIRRTIFPN